MDALTFISNLIEHALWPVVTIGLVVYLLRNLDRFSRAFESVRYKDVEFNFRKEVKDLKDAALDSSVTIVYAPRQLGVPDDADANPYLLIMNTWGEIEQRLFEWERARHGGGGSRNPGKILKELRDAGLVSEGLYELAARLYKIRNEMVHAPKQALAPGEVLEYLGIAHSVQSRLHLPVPAPQPTPPRAPATR